MQQQQYRDLERQRLADREIRRREHERMLATEQEAETKLMRERTLRHERSS